MTAVAGGRRRLRVTDATVSGGGGNGRAMNAVRSGKNVHAEEHGNDGQQRGEQGRAAKEGNGSAGFGCGHDALLPLSQSLGQG